MSANGATKKTLFREIERLQTENAALRVAIRKTKRDAFMKGWKRGIRWAGSTAEKSFADVCKSDLAAYLAQDKQERSHDPQTGATRGGEDS